MLKCGKQVHMRAAIKRGAGDRAAVTAKRQLRLTPFVIAAVLGTLLIPLIAMLAVRSDQGTAEWWTRNVARGWERAVGAMTSWLPISVFELLLCLAILIGVYLIVRFVINLCRGRFYRVAVGALSLGTAAAYVLNLYVLSMGFGYYRARMPLKQAGEDYNAYQAATAAEYFIKDFNALAVKFERDENYCVKCPYTRAELAELMKQEYARLDDDYFSPYTPTIKPVANSWLLSDMLITGITFLPVGEASVNISSPPTTITYTMAHELAHTKGVQREGDANLLTYYILVSSSNDYLRYCGYYASFYGFISAVELAGDEERYGELYNSISRLPAYEHHYAYEYWQSQPDVIGKISEYFNNLYLKNNGVENGTESYDDGKQTDVVPSIDPDTGQQVIDPDTHKPVFIPVYSSLQKMYFYLYEQANGTPPKEPAA